MATIKSLKVFLLASHAAETSTDYDDNTNGDRWVSGTLLKSILSGDATARSVGDYLTQTATDLLYIPLTRITNTLASNTPNDKIPRAKAIRDYVSAQISSSVSGLGGGAVDSVLTILTTTNNEIVIPPEGVFIYIGRVAGDAGTGELILDTRDLPKGKAIPLTIQVDPPAVGEAPLKLRQRYASGLTPVQTIPLPTKRLLSGYLMPAGGVVNNRNFVFSDTATRLA